jgi:hypothetical protein
MNLFQRHFNIVKSTSRLVDFNAGWLGPHAEQQALQDLYSRGLLMSYSDVAPRIRAETKLMKLLFDGSRPYTWELERSLHNEGKLPYEIIPTYEQDTGNCVAAALAMAGQKRHVIELTLGREEELYREWFIPWIYAVSRNQVGGGLSGDGSTGAWGAQAVNKYGVLFCDDKGVPPTDGYSDKWGDRDNALHPEYQRFFEVAEDNPVKIARLTKVEQIIEAIKAGRMCTIASTRGFEMKPRKLDGFHVFQPGGTWYHQMSYCDYMEEPFPALYRCNQWGPEIHGPPLNNETPGGAWNLVEDVAAELRQRSVEVYCYFNFAGEQSEEDLGIL